METINIEQMKALKREMNLKELRKDINKKWVIDKIEKYLEKNSYLNMTVEEVKKRILQDDLAASFFIKDPSKQNLVGKTIKDFIVSLFPSIVIENTSVNNIDIVVSDKSNRRVGIIHSHINDYGGSQKAIFEKFRQNLDKIIFSNVVDSIIVITSGSFFNKNPFNISRSNITVSKIEYLYTTLLSII